MVIRVCKCGKLAVTILRSKSSKLSAGRYLLTINAICYFPFLTADDIPAECSPCVYKELDELNRYWSHDNHNHIGCDSDTISDNQWYRFTRDAGIMMATYCIPRSSCNTHMAGWINGSHPIETYELMSTTVCFHGNQNCCHISYPVQIRNCSGFYVYRLQKPSKCDARHCGVNGKVCFITLFHEEGSKASNVLKVKNSSH